jgi:hypothetical protein
MPLKFKKTYNERVRKIIKKAAYDYLVIEECIARKWAGREISDTAFEAGRFAECASNRSLGFFLISRSKVRGHLVGRKGKDSTIIEELIRQHEPELYFQWQAGKISRPKMIIETKKGFFKGFKGDVWQAYALAVTFINTWRGRLWEN